MFHRRISFSLALVAAIFMMAGPVFVGGQGSEAEARPSESSRRTVGKRTAKKRAAKKRRQRKRRSRRRRRKSSFRGHAVGKSKLRKVELERPSGDVWVVSENLKEEIKVNIYGPEGEFDDEALAALDHEFRCRRTREERAVDPRLYEMLSRIHDHFDGKKIHLVSGFRFQRNEGSRHYHASAMDIRIPGVSVRKLRAYAASLDTGGMGIGLYPRSNFVHVDFRAPGQPSYRWVDRSRPGQGSQKGKRRSRRYRRRSPNS